MDVAKEKNELLKAWKNGDSPIYLELNIERLWDYCKRNGIKLTKEELKAFTESQYTSDIQYERSSKIKISQLAKSYTFRPKFFSQLHLDVFYLAKDRKYGTSSRKVMLVTCQLTRYTFLINLKDLTLDKQKNAFLKILDKIKNVYPKFYSATLFSDGDSVYRSNAFKVFLQSLNIKSNVVRHRAFRSSRGASVAERFIRKARLVLEAVIRENPKLSFDKILVLTENTLNNKIVKPIKMSPKEALNHKPMDLINMSESYKLKSKPYFLEKISNEKRLKIGQIVRVRIFVAKSFHSTVKESYGRTSDYFVIYEVDSSRQITYYKIADIFNFTVLKAMYSEAELDKVNISLLNAISKMEYSIMDIIRFDKNLVTYKSYYRDYVFTAQKSIVTHL